MGEVLEAKMGSYLTRRMVLIGVELPIFDKKGGSKSNPNGVSVDVSIAFNHKFEHRNKLPHIHVALYL